MIATWKASNGEQKDFNVASTQGFDQIATITDRRRQVRRDGHLQGRLPGLDPALRIPGVVKAESVKDAETFNTGWKALNNDWLSGPFKVESFDNSQKVLTVVPNDKWWGEKPLLDKITFRAISPDATAAAFANNELDSFDIGPDPDAYQRVKGVADASHPAGRRSELPALHLQHQGRRADRPEGAPGHRQGPGPRGHRRLRPGRHRLAGPAAEQQHPAAEPGGLRGRRRARPGSTTTWKAPRPIWTPLGWTAGSDGIREKDGKKLAVKFAQLSGVAVSENEALQAQNMLKEIGVKVDIVDVPIAKFQDGSLLSNHEFEIMRLQLDRDPVPVPGHQPDLRHRLRQQLLASCPMPEIDANAKKLDTETDVAGADRRWPTRRRRSSGRT